MHRASKVGETVPVDYQLWATGRPTQITTPPKRIPNPVKLWDPLPEAWMNDYKISGETIEQSKQGQDNWNFGQMGQGAMRFKASNAGGGLCITLNGSNHSDIAGYVVVLDDDNHESYVLKPVGVGSRRLRNQSANCSGLTGHKKYIRVPRTTTDPTFRLNADKDAYFWLIYSYGVIVVGEGTTPGVGRIILYMDAEPFRPLPQGREIYHYGFAKMGRRWKYPIHITESRALRYTQGPTIPRPQNTLSHQAPPSAAPIEDRRMLYRGDNFARAVKTPVANGMPVTTSGFHGIGKGPWGPREFPHIPLPDRR